MLARWKTYVIMAKLETTHGQYRTSYLVELSDMESVVSDVQQTMNNLKSSVVHRILRRLHNGALSNSLHTWRRHGHGNNKKKNEWNKHGGNGKRNRNNKNKGGWKKNCNKKKESNGVCNICIGCT